MVISARDIIFDYFDFYNNGTLQSLMDYLDTDTLVSWFVDEGYVDSLDEDEQKIVNHHYELHCM